MRRPGQHGGRALVSNSKQKRRPHPPHQTIALRLPNLPKPCATEPLRLQPQACIHCTAAPAGWSRGADSTLRTRHVAQRCINAALRRHRVAAGGEQLGDAPAAGQKRADRVLLSMAHGLRWQAAGSERRRRAVAAALTLC